MDLEWFEEVVEELLKRFFWQLDHVELESGTVDLVVIDLRLGHYVHQFGN